MNTPLAHCFFGLLFIAIAVFGVVRGAAFCRGFCVSREDEPVSFWISILVQLGLGIVLLLSAWGILRPT